MNAHFGVGARYGSIAAGCGKRGARALIAIKRGGGSGFRRAGCDTRCWCHWFRSN